MKIMIMGTGAIGGCYGGLLSKAGEDVLFVARGDNLKAIRKNGLRVEGDVEDGFTVHPSAIEKPDDSWKADLILFCVKGYHNQHAMELVAPSVSDSTTILTLQNGIGSGDQLAQRFGKEKVLLGAAYIDAMRKGPGVFGYTGSTPRIVFGEESGEVTERALKIRKAFDNAGIEGHISDDIHKDLWNKLIYICALSGMSCITRASFADVINTPETLALTRRVLQEAYEVGCAKGVHLDDGIVEATMETFLRDKDEMLSSMYLDLQAGNPLELSVINGAVSRMGDEVGVDTPVNDFIKACLTIADNKARSESTS